MIPYCCVMHLCLFMNMQTHNPVLFVCQQWWVSRQWSTCLHRHARAWVTGQLCTELPRWATVMPWLLSFREAVLWTCRTEWVDVHTCILIQSGWCNASSLWWEYCVRSVWGRQHCAAWGVLARVLSLCQTAGEGRSWRTHPKQGRTIITVRFEVNNMNASTHAPIVLFFLKQKWRWEYGQKTQPIFLLCTIEYVHTGPELIFQINDSHISFDLWEIVLF